jgi:CelD/BcsL family acetyltransferase involved in cellulose biosynthesis
MGAVALRRAGAPAEVDAALADFLALEAAGWKGTGGTAIALDPALVRFYEAIARDAAARGALAARALTLDGRPVAMHLGIVHRGVYHLPKTAYDERLGAVSPGQLLQREVLAECEARGLAAFDFLGPDMAWKRDWEPELAPHDWLYVYRPSLAGRLLHGLKHRVRPAVKEVLSWLR